MRTKFDGSTVSDSNNYKKSEKIVRKLERKYGLQQAEASNRSPLRAPDKDELEMVQCTGRASQKMILQEKVNTALLKSSTLKTLITHLERAGVQALFNQASTGRISGMTYFMDDFKAKGQALGNRFKWANVINTVDYEQARDSQEISEANLRTRAKYGESSTGRSGGARPDGRNLENHAQQLKSPGQIPNRDGGGDQEERLTLLDKLEKRATTMEGTIAKLVNQQEKTRRLLMTIFFMGIVPLLAFLTALVLKVWILT